MLDICGFLLTKHFTQSRPKTKTTFFGFSKSDSLGLLRVEQRPGKVKYLYPEDYPPEVFTMEKNPLMKELEVIG